MITNNYNHIEHNVTDVAESIIIYRQYVSHYTASQKTSHFVIHFNWALSNSNHVIILLYEQKNPKQEIFNNISLNL